MLLGEGIEILNRAASRESEVLVSVVFVTREEDKGWISRHSEVVADAYFDGAVYLANIHKHLLFTILQPGRS